MFCYKCSHEIRLSGSPGRLDECPRCEAELHCCLNCRFYSPGKPNDCAEPEVELVVDKDRANFCEFFQANPAPPKQRRQPPTGDEARNLFNKLFGE
jgi:hypothetical protein